MAHQIPGKSAIFLLVLLCLSVACTSPATKAPATLPSATPPTAPTPTPPSLNSQPAGKTSKNTNQSSPSTAGKADGKKEASEGSKPDAAASEGSAGEQAVPVGQALTTEEQTAALDKKLTSSLSKFDRMLLREQELLQEKGGAGAGSGGGGGNGTSGGQGETGSEQANAQDPSSQSGSVARSNRPPRGEEDRSRVPKDVGSGENDDIVARQLREAAVAEDDPELRAKLWDEYRKYKGIKQKGSKI